MIERPRQPDQSGPDEEQLGLDEDLERLAEIGELILAGHARVQDFDLTVHERSFMSGYLGDGVP